MFTRKRWKREIPPLSPKIALSRVYLNAGGYDSYGSYWGRGLPLYQWTMDNPEVIEVGAHWSGHLRAATRAMAKSQLRARFGAEVRFYA